LQARVVSGRSLKCLNRDRKGLPNIYLNGGSGKIRKERTGCGRIAHPVLLGLASRHESIRTERRSQEGHIIFRKERAEYLGIGPAISGCGSEFFIELMTAAGSVDHNEFSRLVRQVEKSMRDFGWKIGEPTLGEVEDLLANPDFEPAFQNVDCFLLLVMNMQGRTALRGNLNDEVVEGSACVLTRHFEDEIPARAGLKSETFSGSEYLVE
jgi:hypothetical protein